MKKFPLFQSLNLHSNNHGVIQIVVPTFNHIKIDYDDLHNHIGLNNDILHFSFFFFFSLTHKHIFLLINNIF